MTHGAYDGDEATTTTDDIVINDGELYAEPVEVAVFVPLYHSPSFASMSCSLPLSVSCCFVFAPCQRCGTRQCAIRKPRCGSSRSGVARNPYKKHIPLPQEAKQHVQDIVESPQQRHFVCVTFPFPSLCSSYRNSLGATSLPVPCFLPLPFWVCIQLQLSSLNCGTNRKEKNRNQKRKKGATPWAAKCQL